MFWSQGNTDIDELNGSILSAMCVAKMICTPSSLCSEKDVFYKKRFVFMWFNSIIRYSTMVYSIFSFDQPNYEGQKGYIYTKWTIFFHIFVILDMNATTDVLMMRLSYRYICRAPLNILTYFFYRLIFYAWRAVKVVVIATIYYYITFWWSENKNDH